LLLHPWKEWNDYEQSELESQPVSWSKYEGKGRGEVGATNEEKIIFHFS
jgi:hypothetical protein